MFPTMLTLSTSPTLQKKTFLQGRSKRLRKTSSYQADQKVCETGLEVEAVSVLGEDYDANEVAWEIMITARNHEMISESGVALKSSVDTLT